MTEKLTPEQRVIEIARRIDNMPYPPENSFVGDKWKAKINETT